MDSKVPDDIIDRVVNGIERDIGTPAVAAAAVLAELSSRLRALSISADRPTADELDRLADKAEHTSRLIIRDSVRRQARKIMRTDRP